jgi:hypothetical protein
MGLMDIAEQVAILLGKQFEFRSKEKVSKKKAYFDPDNQIAVSEKPWLLDYIGFCSHTKTMVEVPEKKVAIYKMAKETFVLYYFNGSTLDMDIYDKIFTLGIKKVFNRGKQGPIFIKLKDDVWISISPRFPGDDANNMETKPTKIVSVREYTSIDSTLPKKLKGSDRYNEILNKLKYKTSTLSGLR